MPIQKWLTLTVSRVQPRTPPGGASGAPRRAPLTQLGEAFQVFPAAPGDIMTGIRDEQEDQRPGGIVPAELC
ncbi:hypothetical protein [Sphingobium sp. DC-2]|uniref:hypothetical protein n=1 Tax=Sphingobium sp. DC-2 TaxID=1303256 RepID=UPI0004C34ABC|nr:hypothetical protein [Sphingobium sp. DC-2]